MPPEMVRVTNVGNDDFTDGYANQKYRVPSGDKVIIPWGAACLWFGDPEIIDRPTLSQFDRRDEVDRIYMRMGCYDGDGETAASRFQRRKPAVLVESLEGAAIPMLVEQMDGSVNTPVSLPQGDERTALAGELERMKAMQAELLSRLNVLEAGEESFDELPVDTPTQIPVDQ